VKDSTTIFLTLPDWSGTTRAPESNAGACNSDIDGSSTYRVGLSPGEVSPTNNSFLDGFAALSLDSTGNIDADQLSKTTYTRTFGGPSGAKANWSWPATVPPRAPLISTVLASIRRPARSKPQRGRSPITTSFTKRRVSFPIFFSRTFARSHTFRPHRLNLYVVLRKLISKLRAAFDVG
jgi:hypothetical protein